jgi:threonylcarbamoyladenosine tRNA methylthiotransferase MtaB
VLGTHEKFDIPKYLGNLKKKSAPEIHSCEIGATESFSPSWSLGDRTRSFLKVQDGCDYKCSYCTIPMARGSSRNLSIAECVREAQKIAESGVKEIVLTGINTGDFGKSTGEKFSDLLTGLMTLKGIERYRISSIEPNLITDAILEMAALGSTLMPHFHIPLQSGCNITLANMKRRYTRELFADRVSKIRSLMPMAGIGADVITGFPGETDADFADTFNFIDSMPLSYLHVFRFSERPGTVAAEMKNQVPNKIKELRSQQLIRLSESKKLTFNRQHIGMIVPVLFEQMGSDGFSKGFTTNYVRVQVPSEKRLTGNIRSVKLLAATEDGSMTGELTGG